VALVLLAAVTEHVLLAAVTEHVLLAAVTEHVLLAAVTEHVLLAAVSEPQLVITQVKDIAFVDALVVDAHAFVVDAIRRT